MVDNANLSSVGLQRFFCWLRRGRRPDSSNYVLYIIVMISYSIGAGVDETEVSSRNVDLPEDRGQC